MFFRSNGTAKSFTFSRDSSFKIRLSKQWREKIHQNSFSRHLFQLDEETSVHAFPAIYFKLTKKPVFMLFPPFISNWRRNQFSHAFPAIFLIDGEKTTYGQVGHWKIVLLFRRIWNSYHANNQNYVFFTNIADFVRFQVYLTDNLLTYHISDLQNWAKNAQNL